MDLMETYSYAPLPGAPPVILPDLDSCCQFASALAFIAAPSALRGRLKVFALCGEGGIPPASWKRRTTADVATIAAWANSAPGADMAARCGISTGLVVVQFDDAADMTAAEIVLGSLPEGTVASVSRDGRLRRWLRIPTTVRVLPTRLDLAPGVRVLADGAYVRLPPAGRWTTPPDDDDADYQALPSGWIDAIQSHGAAPAPSVRYFH